MPPHGYTWAPTMLKEHARHHEGHPDASTVILRTCMNSQSIMGKAVFSMSLPCHGPPSPPLPSLCVWLCAGFLLCMGSSLRARILSWGFNLIVFPFPPACAITARTEKVLDKCLLNGHMNKTLDLSVFPISTQPQSHYKRSTLIVIGMFKLQLTWY